MRKQLYVLTRATSSAAFTFLGARCDRMVKFVLERLTQPDKRGS